MSKVRPVTKTGGRRPSEETRERLRQVNRAKYEALTPEQKQAQLARIGRAPKGTAPAAEPPPATPPPAPPTGGPRNPLDDAPGATAGRSNGHSRPQGRVAPPPRFVVPDLEPIATGEPPPGGDLVTEVDTGPLALTEDQVGSLLAFPFRFVALRRGAHWKLRDDERDMIAEPLTRKLNEQAAAARAIAAGGDWLMIVGGLGLVLETRLSEDRKRATDKPDADRSGQGRRATPAADRSGDGGAGQPDGTGSLNGFPTVGGPPASGDAEEVLAPPAERVLRQAF